MTICHSLNLPLRTNHLTLVLNKGKFHKNPVQGNIIPLDDLSVASAWLFVSGGSARLISCI